MFWTVEKLNARSKELAGFRYRGGIPLKTFRCKEDTDGEIGAYPSDADEWSEMRLGDRWQGRDRYLWLAADIELPVEWKGKKVVGRFDFGRTGGGHNSGFESLLFVNGQPFQGVDSNHEEVFFPEEWLGSTVQLHFRLWSGLNGYDKGQPPENRLNTAAVGWLDETVDDLYYTSRAVLETIQILTENQPERHELLALLNRAFLCVDWSRPGSDVFYASIAEARNKLRESLQQLPKHHPVTVQCIGHTHIDVAWLWRLKHTREKAARSFSTVLRLMELYPDYVFLQTQPQLYEYIKTDYPDIYRQIQARVAEGRWEAGGAMWLEADCNLTSGESLVRQILYGTRFFKQEFGVDCKYLWLPDVFGYSWALPQILRKSGIETFMTTKISWNQYNRMPHDTFQWRGIDGSEVLTHFITTPDPGGNEGSFFYTYNGKVTPHSVQGIWNAYQDKSLNRELLLSYGYGDGGGGVNREMLEMRRRLEEMPGVPKVTTGRADEFFARLQERVQHTEEYIHTWDGELYLELHRGTYTSQAYNKRANRKLELMYRETEWLSVLNCVLQKDWSSYAQGDLNEGWKIIMRNQFHDIIPGSSIREVYEDSRVEYAEAEQIGLQVWKQSAASLAAKSEAEQFTIFNGSSWARTDLVCISFENRVARGSWQDASGVPLKAQKSGNDWWVQVNNIPALGYANIVFKPEDAIHGLSKPLEPFEIHEQTLDTPYYKIEWNEQGQLTRIYDKAAVFEVLANGEAGNVLQVFEDKPKSRHEAWDIDIYYQEKMLAVSELKSVTVIEKGSLRAILQFDWVYMDSSISQQLIVYADNRRIDFQTKVDWHEQRRLLKVAFPVNIRAVEATYDIQFGNVKRPTHWNTSWDYARFESVGHQWADLSERGYGVSLLNDCKYGYDIKDHVLRLSLIKSAKVPDDTADQGEHLFTYSLLPHAGDWFAGSTVQEAWSLNNPLTYAQGKSEHAEFSLFSLSTDHVMVDAVKKSEDGESIVLRVHEYAGIRGELEIKSDLPILDWQEANLLESPIGEPNAMGSIQTEVKPYEIKTFLVRLKTR